MSEVSGRPLLVLTVLYGAGIALGGATDASSAWLFAALAVGMVAVAASAAAHGRLLPTAALAALALGALAMTLWQRPAANGLARFLGRGVWVEGTIIEDNAYPDSVHFLRIATTRARFGPQWEPARGIVQVSTAVPLTVSVGDRVQVWGLLELPPDAGNPGQASHRRRLALRGFDAVLRVAVPNALRPLPPAESWSFVGWRAGVHRRLLADLTRAFPPPYAEQTAQLTAGLVFGVQAVPAPDDLTRLFRDTGLLHLLVASGQQVTLLLGFVYGVGFLVARRRTGAWAAVWLLVGLAIVGWYAMLAAGGASIIRAVVIGGVGACGVWLQRTRAGERILLEPDRLTLLALAGLVVLLVDPAALFRPGPQMSFAAVAGLILLAPPLARALGFLPRPVAFWLAAPIAAELAITPLLASHYRLVPVLGAIANLPAAVLIAVILPVGLLLALIASVLPSMAPGPAFVCAQLVHWLIADARVCAALPLARVWTPGWTLTDTLACYAVVALGAWGCTRVAEWLTSAQRVATLTPDTAINVAHTTT